MVLFNFVTYMCKRHSKYFKSMEKINEAIFCGIKVIDSIVVDYNALYLARFFKKCICL